MNIYDFSYERDSLSLERQRAGLEKLFNLILQDIEHFDGLIDAILENAVEDESNDMFGTEGADI